MLWGRIWAKNINLYAVYVLTVVTAVILNKMIKGVRIDGENFEKWGLEHFSIRSHGGKERTAEKIANK